METYLDRIKDLKAEKKMTNEQLSERSGIPLGTLSKMLAGMNDSPKLSSLVAICEALDCSIEYVVTGVPENTNNYTLTPEEIRMVEDFRTLDRFGQDLVSTVISKEAFRVASDTGFAERSADTGRRARILRPTTPSRAVGDGRKKIPLYELPVSAGVGVYLDEARAEKISVPVGERTADADYALRISGNSMEPKYHDGDLLLVEECESVEVGELGIFLLDGCGFFKVYGGDRLLSLNPDYAPILLKDYDNVQCHGRVVGKLKRK